MTELLVYAHTAQAVVARSILGAACAATGTTARLDVFGSGSLYQRLGSRRAQPWPDLVWWFGPFAARAAALDGLLQSYQPSRVADAAQHDPDWKWTSTHSAAIGVIGVGASRWEDLATVSKLAIADPERSEVGLITVLASLDRARQVEGDAERGWSWWQQRVAHGVVLTEDDADALAHVQAGTATHALTLSSAGAPVAGLARVPHAIGIAATSKNVDAAKLLLDWLVSEATADALPGSPWRLANSAGPLLDVDWGRQQYATVRQRWASSGFGPTPQS
jgi:ABC-type Fe3+ transport system substrate-binding protein